MSLWLRHPRSGQPDTMLTLSVVAFITVIAKTLASGVTITVASRVIDLGTIDPMVIGALLTPTLGAYVMRKMKEDTTTPASKEE